MISRKILLPYLALGAGILALSFSALFVRWANAPAPVIGFYRLCMATLFLLPAFIHRWRGQAGWRWGLVLFPLLGGLFSGFDQAIWATAIQYTKVANATLLNYIAPLWVALVAWSLYHERLHRTFWVGLGLTLSGALLVLGNDLLTHPALSQGDLLALFSSLFFAAYYLATQRGRRDLDVLSYTWNAIVGSTLTLLTMILALRLPLTGYPSQTYLACLGAALVSQVGGYLTINYALGHLPASVVSPTMIGQPVGTALLAIPFLGEALHPAQIMGGVIVLGGIYLVNRAQASSTSSNGTTDTHRSTQME